MNSMTEKEILNRRQEKSLSEEQLASLSREEITRLSADQIPSRVVSLPKSKRRRKRGATYELYLKATPMSFFLRASMAGTAKGMALVIAIKNEMDTQRTDEVRIGQQICDRAGIPNKYQKRRAVAAVEKTGLFSVARAAGRCPVAKRVGSW